MRKTSDKLQKDLRSNSKDLKSIKNTKAREQRNLKMRSSSMAMVDKTKKRKGMWYVEEVD